MKHKINPNNEETFNEKSSEVYNLSQTTPVEASLNEKQHTIMNDATCSEDNLLHDDDDDDKHYWENKKIHTLGNTGTLGALHAAMGPISTILIDKLAYNGVDVRNQVSKLLYDMIRSKK